MGEREREDRGGGERERERENVSLIVRDKVTQTMSTDHNF